MRSKISFEEHARNQLALQVAMKCIGAKTINSFSMKLTENRSDCTRPIFLNFEREGITAGSKKYLKNRQTLVNEELTQIDKNLVARAASESSAVNKSNDEESYWRSLVNPVRFHRIHKGKASSNVPPRIATMSDKALANGDLGNTVFNTKNIWYFLKPFVGEQAYFAYKFGPSDFYTNDQLNLWNVMFEKTHPDDVISSSSIFNPLGIIPGRHHLSSGQQLAQTLLAHHEKVGANWFTNGQGFGTLLCISVLKIAKKEQSHRKICNQSSEKLERLFLSSGVLSDESIKVYRILCDAR